MSSVHGRIVFGGTFPAEIWHSLYAEGGVACEEFTEPEEKIQWAPYYGRFARGAPSDNKLGDGGGDGAAPPGTAAVGGYDPNAYAPGAGQDAAPLPPPYEPPPQGDVGGGESAGSDG